MRFLHAADLHLDSPLSGVGEIHPSLVTTVRDATLTAFENLVEVALAEGVSVCLIAGDVHEGMRRGLRAQVAFRDGLATLSEAGVRCLVVQGNHDPLSEGWTAVRSWPSGVTVFGSEPSTISFTADGEPVSVSGISYSRRHEPDDLSALLRSRPAAGFHIGLLHSEADRGKAGEGRYSPAPAGALAAGAIDYWALGHVHRAEVRRHGRCCIAHPGCTQGRRFVPAELGPKGVLVGEVVGGSLVGPPRFVAVDSVRLGLLRVDIEPLCDAAEVIDAVAASAGSETAAAGGRPVLARLTLVGRGAPHRALAERPEELLAAARQRCWDSGVWLCDVQDRTAPPIDLRSRAEADDLLGMALAELDTLDPREVMALLPAEAAAALSDDAIAASRQRAGVVLADLLGGGP